MWQVRAEQPDYIYKAAAQVKYVISISFISGFFLLFLIFDQPSFTLSDFR